MCNVTLGGMRRMLDRPNVSDEHRAAIVECINLWHDGMYEEAEFRYNAILDEMGVPK